MKHLKYLSLLMVLVLLAACSSSPTLAPQSNGTSGKGINPTLQTGNFVSSDDTQICYEIFGDSLDSRDYYGFKIDPPVDGTTDGVTYTLSNAGKSLAWESASGVTVLGVVVKGGPNFHLYNYRDTGLTSDFNLHSPVHRRNVPQISHFNFCYIKDVPEGDQGCTPGYWRNHADRWVGADPGDDFDTTFGVDLFAPNITLGQAIWLGGGGVQALARHATAGLLNANGGVPNADGTTVAYKYTATQVIQMVQDAANGTAAELEAIKNLLQDANEAGCPLEGTRSNPVPN